MAEFQRKKSPRAPSIALDEALERVLKVYDRERLHAAPTDVIAQNIGYKSANNGAALSVLASLRYYGLLDRPKDGFLAVSKEVETYRFAPEDGLKRSLLIAFLKSPPLYADLLEKYQSGLPSDANLRFELIQKGFNPSSADAVLIAFRRSVEFAGYYSNGSDLPQGDSTPAPEGSRFDECEPVSNVPVAESVIPKGQAMAFAPGGDNEESGHDRIPVRLPGGRKAWLVIPTPFFEGDKARLKAQIDLLLSEDEQ